MKIDNNWVVGILALLSFLFAVVGVLGQYRVSKNTAALTAYRETAQAWEGKARVLEAEITDLNSDARNKDTKIAELIGKVNVLQDSLTGRAQWEVLDRKITEALDMAASSRTEVHQMHEVTMNNQRQIIGLLKEGQK